LVPKILKKEQRRFWRNEKQHLLENKKNLVVNNEGLYIIVPHPIRHKTGLEIVP
jgi:hypothetical protein